MKKVLNEIQKGEFAKEWMKESADGMPNMNKMRESLGNHQIEKVGKELRSMMNWIDDGKKTEPETVE